MYYKDKNKLVVIRKDYNDKHYAYTYDAREVYEDNSGVIRCLKCMGEVNRMYKGDTQGTVYCKGCGDNKGTFHSNGFLYGPLYQQ
jgi:hypothetical protein